jgi:hypothetical protein
VCLLGCTASEKNSGAKIVYARRITQMTFVVPSSNVTDVLPLFIRNDYAKANEAGDDVSHHRSERRHNRVSMLQSLAS